ncbi:MULTISPECIES: S1C family serine protease [unclassified Streptomyces]|uniref:S1C family serine protease n=1 Tax=unclassified Streptomyces TaxID=2593676 RepID=UPI001F033200|nr:MULTISPECIES: trypsin-like peptidase domain-containing protein [unclassified Streptomyces]MCH0564481.1 trypsin-like peptidase domain-containing protein [Streptomyces sp. MUM 2J]MCH0569306.1 trypsin-like peptidase domain-containing protein [Streptomyces sp. MUM 136J]
MSTENEGTEVPPAPSAPPVPVASPATPSHPAAPEHTPQPAPESGAATAQPPAVPAGHQEQPPHHARPAAPYASAQGGTDPQHPAGDPSAPGAAPAPSSAPHAGWPPPPPPTLPGYADGGAGSGAGWGASYQQQPAPKKPGRGGLVAAVLVAALIAGGVGGGIGYQLAKGNDGNGSTTVSASTSGGDVKRDPGTVASVAAKALPSTVTIEAESTNGEGGTGTGFVFDTQGHIVTNNHVVADAVDGGTLTATFPDGKKYDATVVGHAQGYDVAVIKLKNAPSDLKPLPLGNSDEVAVGDTTIAIGAPFGLSNTVTTGIISAKNRPVASSDGRGSQASYMSALQTDASINPGNSGGPLLDAQGNVIGINSAIQSTSGGGLGGSGQSGSIGLGFAIPINQAKYVAQQLIKTGKPVYARIGASVSLENTTDGAKITDQGAGGSAAVEPGGPAAQAGLKPGDVITQLDDHVIDSGPTLIGEIWTHKPGDKVTLTYERNGKSHTVQLTLGARSGDS